MLKLKKSKIINIASNFYHSDTLENQVMTKRNKLKNVCWMRVNSAFRKLAIYKAHLFLKYNYDFLILEKIFS